MPNVATVLKQEITRLARKEIRTETAGLRNMSRQYRRDIAALKRQVAKQEKHIEKLQRQAPAVETKRKDRTDRPRHRFTSQGLKSQRKRLGLSAADYGKLVGVTQQTIYNWEHGIARPRQSQVTKLAALRTIGKKEAYERLQKDGSKSA